MLFQAKAGAKFRRAHIGAPAFPPGTDFADWPNEPIEITDGVPFLIIERGGYLLGGEPEAPSAYVRYCLKECDWNGKAYKPKSKEEKRKALEKLVTSHKIEACRAGFESQID